MSSYIYHIIVAGIRAQGSKYQYSHLRYLTDLNMPVCATDAEGHSMCGDKWIAVDVDRLAPSFILYTRPNISSCGPYPLFAEGSC